MKRPSYKELTTKIRGAQAAVDSKQVYLIDQDVIAQDAIDLEYDVETQLIEVLAGLLKETTPDHYAGVRPPQRSYQPAIEGLELFAFAVESSQFKCCVYVKFALLGEALWLVSLHQDKPSKEDI